MEVEVSASADGVSDTAGDFEMEFASVDKGLLAACFLKNSPIAAAFIWGGRKPPGESDGERGLLNDVLAAPLVAIPLPMLFLAFTPPVFEG